MGRIGGSTKETRTNGGATQASLVKQKKNSIIGRRRRPKGWFKLKSVCAAKRRGLGKIITLDDLKKERRENRQPPILE